MRRRGHKGKVDANQGAIVSALRKAGASVVLLSELGSGVPDLLCARGSRLWLIEVKGEKGKLTPDQVTWRAQWRGPEPIIVRSIDDALAVLR